LPNLNGTGGLSRGEGGGDKGKKGVLSGWKTKEDRVVNLKRECARPGPCTESGQGKFENNCLTKKRPYMAFGTKEAAKLHGQKKKGGSKEGKKK